VLFIDTDVLAIHHLFIRDRRRGDNERFLAKVRAEKPSITIHNLLELCGLFAVANQCQKVPEICQDYLQSEDFLVYFPKGFDEWTRYTEQILEVVGRGHSYGDALVASSAEEGGVQTFVTWNTQHFEGSINAEVLSPTEYIEGSH